MIRTRFQLLIALLFLLFVSACQKESYVVVEKEGFQSFVDTSKMLTPSAKLTDLYFYYYLQNGFPAMAKVSYSGWSENRVLYTSGVYNVRDLSRNKLKISIGAEVEGDKIKIVEIRKSWSCFINDKFSRFSNEKCN